MNSGAGDSTVSDHEQRAPAACGRTASAGGHVPVLDAREEGPGPDRRRRREPRRQRRDDGLRDQQRGEHRDHDRHRDVHHEDRYLALLAEDDRQEHDHGRERAGEHRESHLGHAGQRRLDRVRALELPVAEDALGHHHCVVDQQPDRQQHAHHRQDVEREAEEVHGRDGDQQRERHGEADDQRGRPVAQEQEQHDQREPGADQPGVPELAERAADALGLVLQHDDVDALQLRQLALLLHRCDDALGDVDDVGAGRLEDVEADARAAVQVAADRQLRSDETHVRDVAQPHVPGHDEASARPRWSGTRRWGGRGSAARRP